MNDDTSKINQDQIDGSIVNSVSGPSVNSDDPKNIIIPEIPSPISVENKADKDGSNTAGGIWIIDYIMSEILPNNKSVIRATYEGHIVYGSQELNAHIFEVNSTGNIKLKRGQEVGEVWNSFNFKPDNYYTKQQIGELGEVPNWSNELNINTNF